MRKINFLAAAIVSAAAFPAMAADFNFYQLGNGAGDFLPLNGVACTGGDLCSSDVDSGVLGGNLSYQSGGVGVLATATFNGAVATAVQDHQDGWTLASSAGLGVYHILGDNTDDNITQGETLTLSFDQVVDLTSIVLRSDGHNFTSWVPGATFLLNGVSMDLPLNTGSIALNSVGQVFNFDFGGANADQYYVAAVTVAPVPEPSVYGLLMLGLGAIGFASRRRRS